MIIDANSAVIAVCCMKPISVSLNFILSSIHSLSLSWIRCLLWNRYITRVFTGSCQTKVCSPHVFKQLPCPWRKHGTAAWAVKKTWQLSIFSCTWLVMTAVLVGTGTSGIAWPCGSLSPCCLLWGEKVGKPRNLGEPQAAPVPVCAKAVRQGWGRRQQSPSTRLQLCGVWVALYISVVFFCLFGVLLRLLFLLRALRYWMGY